MRVDLRRWLLTEWRPAVVRGRRAASNAGVRGDRGLRRLVGSAGGAREQPCLWSGLREQGVHALDTAIWHRNALPGGRWIRGPLRAGRRRLRRRVRGRLGLQRERELRALVGTAGAHRLRSWRVHLRPGVQRRLLLTRGSLRKRRPAC